MSEASSDLEARIAELERRMDDLLARIGYMPGEAPIQRDESQWQVSDEVLKIAGSGKEKDLAKAILLHIRQTGAEPEPARQAVLQAIGRGPSS
jgi:hypothetical protein